LSAAAVPLPEELSLGPITTAVNHAAAPFTRPAGIGQLFTTLNLVASLACRITSTTLTVYGGSGAL